LIEKKRRDKEEENDKNKYFPLVSCISFPYFYYAGTRSSINNSFFVSASTEEECAFLFLDYSSILSKSLLIEDLRFSRR
jgi:hypothetical protein